MLVCGERGNGDGSTPYVWLSNIALLPWLPGFLPPACPTTISSLTSPQSISPQSTVASPWDCSTIPKLQAPATAPSGGARVPVQGMYDCGKDYLILTPFRLPQMSCFTLSLKCFSSDSDNCPNVGIGLLLQFPHPPRAGPVLLTLLLFPLIPSSY